VLISWNKTIGLEKNKDNLTKKLTGYFDYQILVGLY